MSDTGLHSHWYQRIRNLAELVDGTLIEIRSNDDARESSGRLGELLTASAPSATLTRQLLSVLLRDANSDVNLESIGRDLRQHGGSTDLLRQLERLADILERERTSTIEQMRK